MQWEGRDATSRAVLRRRWSLATLRGDQDAGGTGGEVRCAVNPINNGRRSAGGCDRGVPDAGREARRGQGPSAKEMQAKIGQLALEVDFLEVALGRVGDASAKR